MNIYERNNMILEELHKVDFLRVEDLVELTGSSIATIRRDLKLMEEKKLIRRFRGGACLAEPIRVEAINEIDISMQKNLEEKKKIAEYAAGLIQDGDVIFLDSGSTTYQMIPFLTNKDILVVTNGILHLNALVSAGVQCYGLEGKVRTDSKSIFGENASTGLLKLNINKAFLGCLGVHASSGYSTTDCEDGMLKSAAISKAEKSYVLADASKLACRKFYNFAQLREATLITNRVDDAVIPAGFYVIAD